MKSSKKSKKFYQIDLHHNVDNIDLDVHNLNHYYMDNHHILTNLQRDHNNRKLNLFNLKSIFYKIGIFNLNYKFYL